MVRHGYFHVGAQVADEPQLMIYADVCSGILPFNTLVPTISNPRCPIKQTSPRHSDALQNGERHTQSEKWQPLAYNTA